MVNTFVTYQKVDGNKFIPDYARSASSLDKQRLLKQIVEASQILNILKQLKKIAKLESWELYKPFNDATSSPEEIYSHFLERVDWVKQTRSRYLSLEYRYAFINGKMQKYNKKELPRKLQQKDKFVLEGSRVKIGDKYFERNHIALPEDKIFSLGFSQHAIVKMWIGYEQSLKEYINAHIDSYCTKKKKNGENCSIKIKKFELPEFILHPWWLVYFDGVVLSHRASLLRKEYYRKESIHYFSNPDFTKIPDEWKKSGYVWTGSLKNTFLILKIIKGEYVHPNDICAPVNEKKKQYLLDKEGFIKIFFNEKY